MDVSIWLTQFIKAMRDDDGKVMKNAHIIGTLRRVVSSGADKTLDRYSSPYAWTASGRQIDSLRASFSTRVY